MSARRDAELLAALRLVRGGGAGDLLGQIFRAVLVNFQFQRAVRKKSEGFVVSIDFSVPIGEDDSGRIHTDENALFLCCLAQLFFFASCDGSSPFAYAAAACTSAASWVRTAVTIFP